MKSIDLTGFNAVQNRAILDLLVLGMYSDHHLAAAEDRRIHAFLQAAGFPAEYDQNREFDAAVTRVRPHLASMDSAQKLAANLVRNFEAADLRSRVSQLVEDLLKCDRQVTAGESLYLTLVREALRI
jgi:hypothetical protein